MGVVLALPFTYKMGVEPALILLTAMYVSGHLWRRDHRHPVPHSRRADGRAAAVGRLCDDAQGPGGQSARLLAGCGARRRSGIRGGDGGCSSKPVASVALSFSSPEFFAITAFGLMSVVTLGGGIAGERADQPVHGPADRHGGRGRDVRRRALRLRRAVPAGRHRVPAGDGGCLRHRRGAHLACRPASCRTTPRSGGNADTLQDGLSEAG
jgi:hypothetical protein